LSERSSPDERSDNRDLTEVRNFDI